MVAKKHSTKIILAVMAVAVVLCLLAVAFSGPLTKLFGGTGVKVEYESKLFNTDEIISVDIRMDEDEWSKMLQNAISEEYYVCDVVINGKKVNNVAIRPKGNTSLSAIAMDPDSDRYSLKLEFDHFVDGQTCYGLDKLILNNNYADATNMKEAIIYDMYGFLGATSSLYNYAKVSVNGEYWGVYLALEGVEQSFMLRNFGTQDGELYKPDSMEMGGGDSSSSKAPSGGSDKGGFGGMTPPSGGFPQGGSGKSDTAEGETSADTQDAQSGRPSFGGFSGNFDPGNMPEGFNPGSMPGGGFKPGNMPDGFDPGNMPSGGNFNFDPDNMPGDFDPDNMPEGVEPGSMPDGESGKANAASDTGNSKRSGKGGFSGKGGANLNYSDDELDSYSTIWEGEITGTGKADHRRVVTALKNISEGTDLETYLNVDNVLRYMAVHVFSVNMDSLSGSMAHNYYLYEYDGQLDLFPWDYNLSFGGMSMGSGSGTDMVNDAIDTPFSGTQFFDALLEDETYLAQYHACLQQLVDEYVGSGRFEETYDRIRSQIDELVQTDPTAFYSYDEYETAAQMLYDTVMLRAESIRGQLDGSIPSTDDGQRADSSALIDASEIDVKAMGQFSMGGFGGQNGKSDTQSDAAQENAAPANRPDGESMPDADNMPAVESKPDTGNMPDGENAPASDEQASEASSADVPSAGVHRQRPSFSGMPEQSSHQTKTQNLITFGICLAVILVALILAKLFKRRS